ncbi:MAG: putative metalloprotease CJM1_0395 family protein [Candidatus Melainabacteria bacterium]
MLPVGLPLNPDAEQQRAFQAWLRQARSESHNEVYTHEAAHAAAAGAYAGPINILTNSMGIATGGFVQIAMPGLNPADPAGSLAAYKQIAAAAQAPGADMSGADKSVAAQAFAMMGMAQVMMDQQRQGRQPHAGGAGL